VSRRSALAPDPRTDVDVTIRLGQGTTRPDAPVLVDLTVLLPAQDPIDTDQEFTVIMEGPRATALGRMLVSAGRAAGTG
jgi:hypothetical protein